MKSDKEPWTSEEMDRWLSSADDADLPDDFKPRMGLPSLKDVLGMLLALVLFAGYFAWVDTRYPPDERPWDVEHHPNR